MDVIEKLIAGHLGVREKMDILEKIVKMIDSDALIWDNVLKVSSFFDKEVKEHFSIEERVVFPVMKKVLPLSDKQIITEIEHEHGHILQKLNEFKKIAEKHSKLLSRNTREGFIKISQEIIESIIPHAEKEDEKLFPLIQKYFRSENYKELEDLYFEIVEKPNNL